MSIDQEIKSVEVVNKKLSFEKATKKLYDQLKKETGYTGNIEDATERNMFFAKFDVVPVLEGTNIVGQRLYYQLKDSSESVQKVKETKPASGCGPATNYIFE